MGELVRAIKYNAVFILVMIVLMSSIIKLSSDVTKYKNRSDKLEQTVSNLGKEAEVSRLKLNDTVSVLLAEVKNLSITRDNLQSRNIELLKALKLKPKDVGSVSEVVTVVHDIDTVYAETDSFGGIRASLNDPFVNIDVNVLPSMNTIIDYRIKDSLTIVNVEKKHSWLFGLIKWKEHRETKVINHNPKAETMRLQTVEVIE